MNENTILPDDPRLTAYALNEMEPAERTAFEKLLQSDPAARAAVEEIRATGSILAGALESEPAPVAGSGREAAIIPGGDFRKHDGGGSLKEQLKQPIRFPHVYYYVSGLAAACFAVFFVYWQNNHEVAKQYVEMDLSTMPAAGAMKAEADKKAEAERHAKLMKEVHVTVALPSVAPAPALAAESNEVVGLDPFAVSSPQPALLAAKAAPARVRGRSELKDVGAIPVPRQMAGQEFNTEGYAFRKDNDFIRVSDQPQSTFSIDVDSASYANVRRFLAQGQRPPADAVRIEEMVNYFPYQYAPPTGEVPFAAHLEVAAAPWTPAHRLVRIGLKGREISEAARPKTNLVFLIDVSGSMNDPNKLPLVKQSLRMLVEKLRADDRVAIAVYAGSSGLALPSTPGSRKAEILDAIDHLEAGGSTNGALGIQLAYDIAKANFVAGGVNRVVLATDGDFNVGVTSEGELTRLIEEKAKSGVFLSVLGFGMGNYQDAKLEALADKGNGNYAYIDTATEAKKALVEQAGGTLVTIAKDVKIQVEFNPAQVAAYRLIGYENRLLAKEDFNNDKVDAGEIGAGHTVTALYEVVPAGVALPETVPAVEALKYQAVSGQPSAVSSSQAESRKLKADSSSELLTVKIRYKEPAGDVSRKLEFALNDRGARFEDASQDFKFATAVAAFGMALRDSPHQGSLTLADISAWGSAGLGSDAGGYRSEFLGLVAKAQPLLQ